MRTQMVIRLQGCSERGHSKAMKIAAQTEGVESVTLTGKDKNLLLVVGDGLDCNGLTTKLRKKVGHADIVELHSGGAGAYSYVTPRSEYGSNYGYPAPAVRYPPPAPALAPAPEYYSSYNNYKPSYESYKPTYGNYKPSYDSYKPTYESYKPSYGNYNYNLPPPAYPATVVQHEYYPADDQNGCSIM